MVTQVAPMVAAGSAQLIGSQVAMKEGSGTGASAEDNADKCDQLLRAPVGVEEVRKNKSGEIESRQWKIAQTSGEPDLDSRAQPERGLGQKRVAAETRNHQPAFQSAAQ